MSVMGRPRIEIDFDKLDRYCSAQCTLKEIAAAFKVSEDTIERRIKETHGITFAEYFAQKSVVGLISLRSQMFKMALDGDRTMLIWLSKQHLGMSDKLDQKMEVVNERKLTFRVQWLDEEDRGISIGDGQANETPKIDQPKPDQIQCSVVGEAVGQDDVRPSEDVMETTSRS